MLNELCAHLRNWFCVRREVGSFCIKDGCLALPFLLDGQYFRIVGSVLNDGVHKSPAAGLRDEIFCGEVWAMAVPPGLVALCAEIEVWQQKHGDSPYTSESFGGYSYTRTAAPNGAPLGWQGVFRARLNEWRKL